MKQTIKHRRALAKLERLERERAVAERVWKATKRLEWLYRLRELTNACLRAA